jgi:hypothetical protein
MSKFHLREFKLSLFKNFGIRTFGFDLTFASLREVPPCGTKAGILKFDINLSFEKGEIHADL